MLKLENAKRNYCKDMNNNWEVAKEQVSMVYLPDGKAFYRYRNQGYNTTSGYENITMNQGTRYKAKQYICSAPYIHGNETNASIALVRVGPFRSFGGYDWTSSRSQFELGGKLLRKMFKNKPFYALGGGVMPVHANGTIIGYPPVHIHHGHMYPYASADRKKMIKELKATDAHHVLFQSHGDTQCKMEEGGTDCLFHMLDEGEGYRVDVGKRSSARLLSDFELNDVRPITNNIPNEGLEYYLEFSIVYTFEEDDSTHLSKTKPVTRLHIGNPVDAFRGTYAYPHVEHYNSMWFQFKNEYLGDGVLRNPILHTHQTIFDSFFLFKSTEENGDILTLLLKQYTAANNLNGDVQLPIFYDNKCRNNTATNLNSKAKMDFETEKANLLTTVQTSGLAEIVCEVTKPSVEFIKQNGEHVPNARDRRVDFNCLDEIALGDKEVLTVIAFNHARNRKHITAQNPEYQKTKAFGRLFAFYQHTIFRGDFVSKKVSNNEWNTQKDYLPPSYYEYSEREGKKLFKENADNEYRVLDRCYITHHLLD
eukprot:Pgem_evm1s7115